MATFTVFVSSTFLDFNEERDELAGPVRDSVNAILRPSGHRVEVLDLRWGIDTSLVDEQEVEDLVLASCSGAIRRSPIFLGLVGDRVGWRPRPEALERALAGLDADGESLSALQQRLRQMEDLSVTEFEFWLASELEDGPDGVVLRRGNGLDRNTIQGDRTPNDGWAVHDYVRDPAGYGNSFHQVAVDALVKAITLAAERSDTSDRTPYRRALDWYSARLTRSFVGRDALVEEVCDHVRANRRVVLHGTAGVGVSAVLAHVVEALRNESAEVWSGVGGLTPATSTPSGLAAEMLDSSGAVALRPDPFASLVVASRERDGVCVAVDESESLRSFDDRDPLALVRCLMDGSRVRAVAAVHDRDTLSVPTRFERRFVEVPPLSREAVADAVCEHLAPKSVPKEALDHLAGVPRGGLWVQLASIALDQIGGPDLSDAQQASDPAAAIRAAVVDRALSLPSDLDDLVIQVCDSLVARAARRVESASVETLKLLLVALAVAPDGLDAVELRALLPESPESVAPLLATFDDLLQPVDEWGSVRIRSHTVREVITRRRGVELTDVHRQLARVIEWAEPEHRHRRWLLSHAIRGGLHDVVDRVLAHVDVGDEEELRWHAGQLLGAGVPGDALDRIGATPNSNLEVATTLVAAYWADFRYRSWSDHGLKVDAMVRRIAALSQELPDARGLFVEVDWLARTAQWEALRDKLSLAVSASADLPGGTGEVVRNRVQQAQNRLLAHEGKTIRLTIGQLAQNRRDGMTGADPEIEGQLLDDVVEAHFFVATAMESLGSFDLALDAARSAIAMQRPDNEERSEQYPSLLLGVFRGLHTMSRTLLYHREDAATALDQLISLEPTLRDYLLATRPYDVEVLRLHAEHRYLSGHAGLLCGDPDNGWQRIAFAWAESRDLLERNQVSDETRHLYVRTHLARSEFYRAFMERPWEVLLADAVDAFVGMTPNGRKTQEAWSLLTARFYTLIERAKPAGVRPRAWRKLIVPGGLSSSRSEWDGRVVPVVFELDRLWCRLGDRPASVGSQSSRYLRYVLRQSFMATSTRGLIVGD